MFRLYKQKNNNVKKKNTYNNKKNNQEKTANHKNLNHYNHNLNNIYIYIYISQYLKPNYNISESLEGLEQITNTEQKEKTPDEEQLT